MLSTVGLKVLVRKIILMTIVTVDDISVHHYDPKSTISSMQWEMEDPQHLSIWEHKNVTRKVMLTVFWHAKSVLLKDCLPHGNTVNQQYYVDLFTKLRKSDQKIRDSTHSKFVALRQDTLSQSISCMAISQWFEYLYSSSPTLYSGFGSIMLFSFLISKKKKKKFH